MPSRALHERQGQSATQRFPSELACEAGDVLIDGNMAEDARYILHTELQYLGTQGSEGTAM